MVKIYFETSSRLQVFVGKRFVEDVNLIDGQSKAQLVREGKSAGFGPGGTYLEQYLSLVCACDLGSGCVEADKCSTASNQHGANRYDRSTGMLEILVTGHGINDFIEVKTLPIVQISLTLSTAAEDFYKIKDAFVSNLALLLGINPSRIFIVDIGRGKRRRLLQDSGTAVNIEIAPDAVIGFSQANGQSIVLETAGFAQVTVVRAVNLNGRCASRYRTYTDLTDTGIQGSNFNNSEGVIQFESKDTEQVIRIPIISQMGYQHVNATFHVLLFDAKNASIGTSSIQISIVNVHAPAPAPPTRYLLQTATSVSLQWSASVWDGPSPDLSVPSRWRIDCIWSRKVSDVESLGNLTIFLNVSSPVSNKAAVSVMGLLSFTKVSCKVAMETAVGIWSDWSDYSADLFTETICGDGFRQGNEACDDGNTLFGDGCENCTILPGWSCKQDLSGNETCSQGCGDGILTISEQCDDGFNENDDGCDAMCRKEVGWNCSAVLGIKSVCATVCGDGILIPSLEECDAGRDSDGCSPNCKVNPGAICTNEDGNHGMLSMCRVCGNLKVESGEVCDDGNRSGACACTSISPGWSCLEAECRAGPAACPKPTVKAVYPTIIEWEWNAPESYGLPVLSFNGQLMEVTNRTDFDWISAKNFQISGNERSLRVLNLSASTAFIFRVRACSAAGCGEYSPPASKTETLQADASKALLSLSRKFEDLVLTTGLDSLGVNVSNVSVQGPAPSPRQCDSSSCTVGKYRGRCDDASPGECVPCTTAPENTYYIGAGNPYNEDNCSWACNAGFYLSTGEGCLPCNTSSCPIGQFRGPCGTCAETKPGAECLDFLDGQCKLCTGLAANSRFSEPGVSVFIHALYRL
jgi:cysteine-rich repeat protein